MDSGTCGKNLKWTLDDNGTLTISGTGDMKDYILNKSPWYNQSDQIKKAVINSGVTSIGEKAFRECRNLASITIPDSVTSIGDGAFGWCESLISITIPDSVTYIDDRVFRLCRSLTNIRISNSVTTIGERVFSGCKSLTGIMIPESVTSIGKHVFYNCPSLKKIYYPARRGFERVLSQGNSAELIPYVAEKLRWKVEGKTLTVGGVREIKYFSEPPWFDNVRDIQEIIIEEGVEKISANAFIDCRRLELLTIPASVKTIGDLAFTVCYCGNKLANGGKNVFWCLEDGVLILKKNPAVKSASDFSTGSVSWLAVEKNIVGFKLEPGVVPKEKFFEWLAQRGNAMQVSFA